MFLRLVAGFVGRRVFWRATGRVGVIHVARGRLVTGPPYPPTGCAFFTASGSGSLEEGPPAIAHALRDGAELEARAAAAENLVARKYLSDPPVVTLARISSGHICSDWLRPNFHRSSMGNLLGLRRPSTAMVCLYSAEECKCRCDRCSWQADDAARSRAAPVLLRGGPVQTYLTCSSPARASTGRSSVKRCPCTNCAPRCCANCLYCVSAALRAAALPASVVCGACARNHRRM